MGNKVVTPDYKKIARFLRLHTQLISDQPYHDDVRMRRDRDTLRNEIKAMNLLQPKCIDDLNVMVMPACVESFIKSLDNEKKCKIKQEIDTAYKNNDKIQKKSLLTDLQLNVICDLKNNLFSKKKRKRKTNKTKSKRKSARKSKKKLK